MSNTEITYGIVDLETTGREPNESHVVEWACVGTDGAGTDLYLRQAFVKPPARIPAETSAIHHIIDSDMVDAPTWEQASADLSNLLEVAEYLVAHNAEFEKHFLGPLAPYKPWICTYKCSLRAWPDAPSHSNESLRYWLELGDNRGRAHDQEPHSAYHDACVTSLLLERLLKDYPLATLIGWSSEIALLPRCPIGKWRGSKWSEIDYGFLDWIVYKAWDMREDVKHAARLELERRHNDSDRDNPADEVEVKP